MEKLNLPEDQPIESRLVSKVINEAQKKVEGVNFDAREHLLEYDDVMNRQRLAIYKKRREFLEKGANPQILGMLDALWMNHLENMEAMREAVRLRAYSQRDPLAEYRREGRLLYQQLLVNFENWLKENKEKLETAQNIKINQRQPTQREPVFKNVGRNDPCPCGSKKKFKKCHGV